MSSDQDAVADVDDDAVDEEDGEDLFGDALLEFVPKPLSLLAIAN